MRRESVRRLLGGLSQEGPFGPPRARPNLVPGAQPGGVRCLSVKDPWVKLIGLGLKPYELRKMRTNYRGLVVLCSSASPARTQEAQDARARFGLWREPPLGAALYVGELYDCWLACARDARGAWCRPSEGEHVWAFRDVRALPEAVPIKGQLGLYYPTRQLLSHLRRLNIMRR